MQDDVRWILFSVCMLILGLYFYVITTASSAVHSFYLHEGFRNKKSCPDVLVQKGSQYLLFHSKASKMPGVNPIIFNSLDEYHTYAKWQQSHGYKCPLLHVRYMYNAQSHELIQICPGTDNAHAGLPAVAPIQTNSLSATEKSSTTSMPHSDSSTDTATSTTKVDTSLEAVPLNAVPKGYKLPPLTMLVDANHDNPPFNDNMYPSFDPSTFYLGKYTPIDQMGSLSYPPYLRTQINPEGNIIIDPK
jgi:hypothetical protein